MKVLAIGNSFSQNAMTYLHTLSASAGVYMKTVNLYIGGCSLRTHYLNMLEGNAAYDFQFNGISTNLKVDLKQGLLSDEWDVITLQQASPLSFRPETYEPYLTEIADFVRMYFPHTKLMIHQTWAYEEGSEKHLQRTSYATAAEMHRAVVDAYARAAEIIHADGIIPSGEAMWQALKNGIPSVHSDGAHANDVGCYLQGLTWYGYLTGKSVIDVPFSAFKSEIPAEHIAIAKQSVSEILKEV